MSIQNNEQYKFFYGTKNQLDRLKSLGLLNQNNLYYLTDKQQIYVGENLYGSEFIVVDEFPSEPKINTLYIHKDTKEIRIFENNEYKVICLPVVDNLDVDYSLATSKAIRDYIKNISDKSITGVKYRVESQSLNLQYGDGSIEDILLKDILTNVEYDSQTGDFIFSRANGEDISVNTPKENFLSDVSYDPYKNTITFKMVNGSTFDVDLTDLIEIYTTEDTQSIDMNLSGNKIFANLKLSNKEDNRAKLDENGLYVPDTDLSEYYKSKQVEDRINNIVNPLQQEVDRLEIDKQNNLTAGKGIRIDNNVISSMFSNVEWGNIQGDILNQKDLQEQFSSLQSTIESNISTTEGQLQGKIDILESETNEKLNSLELQINQLDVDLSKEIQDTKTEIENTIQPKLDQLDQEIDTKVNLDDMVKIEMVEVDIDGIKSDITNLENTKQDNLTSANAGDGISIVDGVISNTRVSAEWGNIQGDISAQTDLADNYQGVHTVTIDLTDTTKYLDTTWYPVVGEPLYIKRKNISRLVLTRLTGNFNLGGTTPSWSTHRNGYTCVLDLLDVGYSWGNTPRVSHVLQDSTNWTTDNTKPPIRYSQMTNSSKPVFWLRGGGKYYLTTEYDAKWSIKTEAYTSNEQTVTPTTTCPALSLGTQLYAKSVNSTSKGNSTTPVYFDANGVAQPITSYSGNANTATQATKAIQDSNGKQIDTTYMYKTIGSQYIPYTPTGITRLEMVGKQACGNGVIGGGNLISLHSNTAYKCYERKGATITCNYDDIVANLGKSMCDGSFGGHYPTINPSTMFTDKPFVWEVVSPTQFEASDVLRLHLHSHRLADQVNCTAFKIEAYIQDTLDNTKKWVTVYNYSGASVNIAQTGWGLYVSGYSSAIYYAVFGIRLTISSSPDTIFRLSEIQLVASRGTERVCDAIQCLSTDGGKVWGNLEVTGNITSKNTYTKTEIDTKINAKSDKATTLSGYGITDAYTKTESDNKYASIDTFYTKSESDSRYVNATGDTMSGNLTIAKDQGTYNIKEPSLDYTSNPTSQHISAFRCVDKNNKILGDIRFVTDTNGTQSTSLIARHARTGTEKNASLSVILDKDGNDRVATNNLSVTNAAVSGGLIVNNSRITCNQTSNTQPIHINHSSSNGFVSVLNKANDMDFTSTTAPSTSQMAHRYLAYDKNGQHINTIETGHLTNNNFQTLISTRRSVGGTIKTVNLSQIINSTGGTNTLITGSPLDVQNDTFNFVARSATMDITQTPANNQYVGYEIRDKNNARCAYIGVANTTSGSKNLVVQGLNANILNISGMTSLIINGKNVLYVEEQVSGTYNWYRIWSDGRLEQGGRLLNNTTTSGNLVFPKVFINANYTLIISDTEETSTDVSGSSKTCVASDYTTTGFRYNKPSDQCFDWVAFGKIR